MKHAKNTPMKKAMPASAALTFLRQRSVRTASGCRIWSGYTDERGHPKTNIKGTVVSVRKLVYEAINGPVPAKHRLFAACLCRGCIEPTHLEPVHTSSMFSWMRLHGVLDTVENQAGALRSAAKRRVPDHQRQAMRAMAETLPMNGPRGTKTQAIREIAKAFGLSAGFTHRVITGPVERTTVPAASIFSLGASIARKAASAAAPGARP